MPIFPASLLLPGPARRTGLMKESGRRGSRRQALGLMKKSWRRRSLKTNTRSDQEIREATNARRRTLGLMKQSGNRKYNIDLMDIRKMSIGSAEHSFVGSNGIHHFHKVL